MENKQNIASTEATQSDENTLSKVMILRRQQEYLHTVLSYLKDQTESALELLGKITDQLDAEINEE